MKTATDFKEAIYWNRQSYGKAIKIRRIHLIGIFILICVITPATNWMIPLSKKIIKKDLVWRY